jgi:hypothetical protein
MLARALSSLKQGKSCGLGSMGERVELREIRQRADLAEPVQCKLSSSFIDAELQGLARSMVACSEDALSVLVGSGR